MLMPGQIVSDTPTVIVGFLPNQKGYRVPACHVGHSPQKTIAYQLIGPFWIFTGLDFSNRSSRESRTVMMLACILL
jgi:hypothetical protein